MKALFIGRFQPFHKGHAIVLQRLSTKYDELIIGIGSAQYHDSSDNPFSDQERKQMITQTLQKMGIQNYRIVFIPDIHDPPHWVDHVCSLVSDFDIVVTNNPLTRTLFSQKGFVVKGSAYVNRKLYSGKEIRRRIIKDEPWQELVPDEVARLIQNVHGVERIKNLA